MRGRSIIIIIIIVIIVREIQATNNNPPIIIYCASTETIVTYTLSLTLPFWPKSQCDVRVCELACNTRGGFPNPVTEEMGISDFANNNM